MALTKGSYPFPFGVGLDTKSGKQAGSKLQILENGWFLKGGEISKRWGFVSKGIPDAGGALGNGFIGLDDELAAASGGKLYSYDSRNSAWDSKGTLRTAGVTAKSIVQTSHDQLYSDVATLSGITVYAYESNGSVGMVVVDEASGAVLAQSNLGTGGTPRCAVIQDQIYVLWAKPVSGGIQQVFYVHIATGAPTVVSSPIYNNVDLDATAPYFAVASVPNAIFLLYVKKPSVGATNVVVRNLFSGVDNIFLGSTTASALDIFFGPDSNLYCVGAVGANVLFQCFDTNLAPAFAAVSVATGSATATKNVTVASTTAGSADVFFEKAPVGGTPTTNQSVSTFAFASNGTHGAVSTLARSVGIASRAFAPGNISRVGVLAAAVVLVYDSPLQATYFLWVKGSGIVARFLAGTAGGLVAKPFLTSVVNTGGAEFAAALGTKGPLQSLPANVLTTAKTVARVNIDFDQRYRNAQIGRSTLTAGGRNSVYDGSAIAEFGFNVYPEQPTVTGSPAVTFEITQAGTAGAAVPLIVQIDTHVDATTLANDGGAQAAGASYTPSSYILLPWGGDATLPDFYIWFSVDGVGSDPAPTPNGTGLVKALPSNGVEVKLLSTDTQDVVSDKIASAVNSLNLLGTRFLTATAAADSVSVTTVQSGAALSTSTTLPGAYLFQPPAMEESRFGIWRIRLSNDGYSSNPPDGNSEIWRLTCVSGARIASGQFFAMASSYMVPLTATITKYVFYFVVDGVAPAVVPTLPDCIAAVPVAVLSTDTAAQVATKLGTAMGAVVYNGTNPYVVVYTQGPAVAIGFAETFIGGSPHWSPIENPVNFSVGGKMEAGQRQYAVVYRWTDAKGLLYRSAPSIAAITIAAESRNSNKVTVPTLRLTDKAGVKVDVYRTAADVDVAQLVTTLDNDPTVDSLSFWDSTSDTDLASAEFLYTTGGVLPNVCPPPAQDIAVHQDRVFLFGLDDDSVAWYSKKYQDGIGVEFSDLQTLRFDDEGGGLVAGRTMDDKLIVFKQRRIYFMAGDGPNALGQQNSFSDPRVINTGVGCISPESIVFSPMGLMFQSERGLHLLTRDLQTMDIGSNVDDFVTSTVTSAVLLPKSTRIQFTFANGNSVFFDYFFNQWGTATNHEAQAGIVWNGLYSLMREDGTIWIESPTDYSDAGASYSQKIQTPWFKPAGMQGMFRCRKFSFLGTLRGPHILRVDVEYDYEDGVIWDSYYFDPANLAGGLQTPLGQSIGTPGDGASDAYQFQADLNRQKCESIRLTITDLPGTRGLIQGAPGNFGAIQTGQTRVLSVDGGGGQTVTYAATDTSAAAVAAAINAQVDGVTAVAMSGAVRVYSNTIGATSSVASTDGTAPDDADGLAVGFGQTQGINIDMGDSYTIADLTFGIAVKDSTYRFPATRRIG